MSKIFNDVEFQLEMIVCMISSLRDEDYYSEGKHLSSIGAHIRHMLEFLEILVFSDREQPIDYARRKRDIKIEKDRAFAIERLYTLKANLAREDQFVSVLEEGEVFNSSYLREMLYMHEHIVHHCALLKIELDLIEYLELDTCFGFAKSTLKHMENDVSA